MTSDEPRRPRRLPNAGYVRKDPAKWKHAGWTPTPNSIIRDPDIPPDECWAWTWLASFSEEIEISGRKLYEAKNCLGRNRAYDLLSALERRGLLLRYHAYDPVEGVPYIQYELQPVAVPEEERTWEPSKAAPRVRPHPGSRAARSQPEPVDNSRTRSSGGIPDRAGNHSSGGVPDRVPDEPGIRSHQNIPDGAGTGVDSRQGGTRPAGGPLKERKISLKEQHLSHSEDAPTGPDATGPQGEREGESDLVEEHPSPEALEVVLGLRWPTAARRLTQAQVVELATLVDTAVASGYTLGEIGQHATAVLAEARTSPLAYLRGGLQPDQLPARRPRPPAPTGRQVTEVDCVHRFPGGASPTQAGLPRCPQCRTTATATDGHSSPAGSASRTPDQTAPARPDRPAVPSPRSQPAGGHPTTPRGTGSPRSGPVRGRNRPGTVLPDRQTVLAGMAPGRAQPGAVTTRVPTAGS